MRETPRTARGRGARLAGIVAIGVTLFGLLLAVWALTLIGEGRYEAAAWVAFCAALVDLFDGGVARSLGAVSELGRELDSLVDVIGAGVVPGALIYAVYFHEWGFAGVVVSFAWVALVALRLARYNSGRLVEGVYFVGLPCPAAGTVVAQYVVFNRATWGDDGSPWVLAALIPVLGALMLSDVPYWRGAAASPKRLWHHPHRALFGAAIAAIVAAIVVFPPQALFVVTTMWIASTLAAELWRRHARTAETAALVEPAAAVGPVT